MHSYARAIVQHDMSKAANIRAWSYVNARTYSIHPCTGDRTIVNMCTLTFKPKKRPRNDHVHAYTCGRSQTYMYNRTRTHVLTCTAQLHVAAHARERGLDNSSENVLRCGRAHVRHCCTCASVCACACTPVCVYLSTRAPMRMRAHARILILLPVSCVCLYTFARATHIPSSFNYNNVSQHLPLTSQHTRAARRSPPALDVGE